MRCTCLAKHLCHYSSSRLKEVLPFKGFTEASLGVSSSSGRVNCIRSLALSSGVAPNLATLNRSSDAAVMLPEKKAFAMKAVSTRNIQSVCVNKCAWGLVAHVLHQSIVAGSHSPSGRVGVGPVKGVSGTWMARASMRLAVSLGRWCVLLGAAPLPAISPVSLPTGFDVCMFLFGVVLRICRVVPRFSVLVERAMLIGKGCRSDLILAAASGRRTTP